MQGNDELGSSPPAEQPVIIKRVVAGGGHHGGAWKVAYADFVTAMMALFLVLWLMNSAQDKKEAVAAYFNDPRGFSDRIGSGQQGTGSGLVVTKDDMQGLADKIENAMKEIPQIKNFSQNVTMTVTGEGLRIELLETEGGMFFGSGSPAPSSSGEAALTLIAQELAQLPNHVIIEGHTDSQPFLGRESYSNWELSADRANAARRILVSHGLQQDRVAQVRGFADVELRTPEHPEDPSNRRISLIVKMRDTQPDAEASGEKGETAEGGMAKKEATPATPAH